MKTQEVCPLTPNEVVPATEGDYTDWNWPSEYWPHEVFPKGDGLPIINVGKIEKPKPYHIVYNYLR